MTWCYPRFVQGTLCFQRAVLLPETHVQYDAKPHDHEGFRENSPKIFPTFHSTGTVPARPSEHRYVPMKVVDAQDISIHPKSRSVAAQGDARRMRHRCGQNVTRQVPVPCPRPLDFTSAACPNHSETTTVHGTSDYTGFAMCNVG